MSTETLRSRSLAMEALDKQMLSVVDEKGFVPDEVRNAFFRKLRTKTENRTCFECTARNPTWISLSYGIYLCLECSGEHRRKGVHISFVRSVELDKFTPDQMVQMACGGNGKAWEYFSQHAMGKTSGTGRAVEYTSKFAVKYKQQLEKDARATCDKYEVASKVSSAAAADAGNEVADPAAVQQPDTALATPEASVPERGSSAPAVSSTSQPKPSPSGPANVVVRKAAGVENAALTHTPSAGPTRSTGFAGSKQIAKQIEFDFDFDALESEASKPPPQAPPKSVAPVPAAAPTTKSEPTSVGQSKKFTNAKAISSEDFFNDLDFDFTNQR